MTPADRARRQSPLNNYFLAIGLVAIAVILLLVASRFEHLKTLNHLEERRLEATLDMVEVRESIEGSVFDHILMLQKLASHISENPDITQADFSSFAQDVLKVGDDVVNLAAAPDLVVRLVHPLEQNLGAVGLDYRTRPDQLPDVLEAIEGGVVTLSGPVDLVQGGRGLVLRQPVILKPTTAGAEGRLWGIVALVWDVDAFIQEVGLDAYADRYDILIAHRGAGQGAPVALSGLLSVADRDPVVLRFDFPHGDWYLMATDAGGWPSHAVNYVRDRIVMVALAAIILAALGFVLKLSESRWVARRRLSDAIAALGDGFAMFSPDGKLFAYNQKYVECYDTVADLIRPGAEFKDLARAGAYRGQVAEAIGREEDWLRERFGVLADSRISMVQRLSNGRLVRATDYRTASGDIVCMRVDITDLAEANEKAEAGNRAKVEFLNTLSHELRTPLTVIIGIAKLFQAPDRLPALAKLRATIEGDKAEPEAIRDGVTELFSYIADKMKKLDTTGAHLLHLINEMLDYAKIDSGKLAVDPKPCTTDSIVEPIADQLRNEAERKGLRFDVSCVPEFVLADRVRTQQILFNLIGNAIKFTETGQVSLTVRRNGDAVEFLVSDTGMGVAPEDQGRIFEAFQQVDSSETRRKSGTGLGLAISREFAIAQGGTLTVESQPDVGSTFLLSLKAAEEPGSGTDAATAVSAHA